MRFMVPATAASAAPITNVIEMVRSTSTPSSAAIFWSCSQARCARPREVRLGYLIVLAPHQHELALQQRRDRLVARALGDLDEIRQQDRHADGGDQRRQAE